MITKHPNPLIIAAFSVLLLNACTRTIFDSPRKMETLTSKAIFEYLNQPKLNTPGISFPGKGKTKIDPLLCQRTKLELNGKLYFDKAMYSDLLKKQDKSKSYYLVIPDAEKGRYTETGSDQDFEHDYAIIHQFSALLPTIEPNIFLMEHYEWINVCGEEAAIRCIRVSQRQFLRFEIKDGDVKFEKELMLSEGPSDILLFGHFSRLDLERALPGEKISRLAP